MHHLQIYISGTGTGEQANGILYLFNSNNASEYSFYTQEISYLSNLGVLKGNQGGGVQTISTSNNRSSSIFYEWWQHRQWKISHYMV